MRGALGIPDSAVVYGRIGPASMGKWSPVLIRAFNTVAKQSPKAWLAVCGLPDGMKVLVRSLPADVRSRIVELPVTSDDTELRRYYSLMDVFVHASQKGESFGMVLCEAMLAGLPVVTLNTPLRDNSQIEVVPNGVAGFVVNDLNQTVDAMLLLERDANVYQSFAGQGPNWVRENYDIPIVINRLLKIARTVLGCSSTEEIQENSLQFAPELLNVRANSYRDLLSSAGVKQSPLKSLLTSVINRSISRKGIRFVRSCQSMFH
jgi:hypothetical protein